MDENERSLIVEEKEHLNGFQVQKELSNLD
jgi:hypothetical protein